MTDLIESCPFCLGKEGYYEKLVVSYQQFYKFDGTPDGTTEYDSVKGGKQRFCITCNRNISKHTQNVPGILIPAK